MTPSRPDRRALWAVVLLWALSVGGILYAGWDNLASMSFFDPDDALRLVEVRDWMAGQSWFDVTQYRSHPPMGAPMHWSRLVDIPIAAFIHLYALFAGQSTAELLALCTVPFLLLLGLFLIVYRLSLHVTGKSGTALVATAMLASSISILIQFQALRIDHHGWQILLGTLAVLWLLALHDRRVAGGLVPGLVMAVSLTVALESFPLAIAIGAVLGLRALLRAEAWVSLVAYMAALTGAAAVLLFVMLGWQGAFVPWCDSLSPAYILPPAAVTGVVAAVHVLPHRLWWQRLAGLGVAGALGAAIFLTFSHQCLAGPFAALDPVIYKLWYTSVAEGMPVWAQSPDLRALILVPGILGLAGSLLAIRFDGPERRALWIDLLIVQAVTFLVSIFVMRAMGLSHVMALPGTAWLFLRALKGAMSLPIAPARVLLGCCCFALTPIGAELLLSPFTPGPPQEGRAGDRFVCPGVKGIAQLNALPPATLFAPLDIGAHLLAYTHDSVIATGHHRNVEGMITVIRGFIAPPDDARAIIAKTPARYVAICTSENEMRKYAKRFPHSLAAALVKGHAPGWLQPMGAGGRKDIHLYRIAD